MEILYQVSRHPLTPYLNIAHLRLIPSYIIYISFEVAFVYFIFPETSGKTLEELAFCEYFSFHFESIF